MWKILTLLLKGDGSKDIFQSIRELIKGKESDPMEIIRLVNEVNAAEAQHRSIFVAGWRPFIGWICGLAFAFHYIALPLILTYTDHTPPAFDTNSLFTVLMGMLGLGGLRTYEKLKDKSK